MQLPEVRVDGADDGLSGKVGRLRAVEALRVVADQSEAPGVNVTKFCSSSPTRRTNKQALGPSKIFPPNLKLAGKATTTRAVLHSSWL